MTVQVERQDPLLDFGLRFESSATRVLGEEAERKALVARELEYHHGYLDDCLRSILPHDLILLGAATGVGKTQLASSIAKNNASSRKTVHYFGLEAEEKEIERRTKYEVLARLCQQYGALGADDLNYADWYRGRCDGIVKPFVELAEDRIRTELATLFTYYRGNSFGPDDIRRLFLAVQDTTDLIVLDHLQYVDLEANTNENQAFRDLVKLIRDTALGMGKPVILVAHLRKKDPRSKALIPDLDSFYGSSDITKICTAAAVIAPAPSIPIQQWSSSNTFVYVSKDRMSGATGLIAMCQFDRRTRSYLKSYALGRMNGGGDKWEPIGPHDAPRWARHHRPLANPPTGKAAT